MMPLKVAQSTSMRRAYAGKSNEVDRTKWWMFDIGGNSLRLIAFIEFRGNRMYVKHFVSHAGYDRLTEKYQRNKEALPC